MGKFIFYIIAFSSLELYNLAFLNSDFIKAFQLTGIGLLIVIVIVHFAYFREIDFPQHFNIYLLLIFIGVVLSMFMAHWGHGQELTTTFIAQRFMYFYFAYWALHSIKMNITEIENIIFWLGITFSTFYILQYLIYPSVIFNVRIAEDRETIRIFLPGFSFLILSYFLTLNKLFEEFSIGKLLSLFLFVSIFILMGTRQVIFSMLFLTMMMILFSKIVKSKILIIFLMTFSLIPIIFIFQEIFLSLIDLSKQQSETIAENVRIRAAVFFLSELFPNSFAYLTGNGADSSNSTYGYMIQMYRDAYGFYQSDIGLVGDYTRFGAFFAVGVLLIITKIVFGNISSTYVYIKYFFISIALTLFTGGGPFAQADSILAICLTFYILDIDRYEKEYNIEESNQNENELHSEINNGSTYKVNA